MHITMNCPIKEQTIWDVRIIKNILNSNFNIIKNIL
jgi:hypothetical protein